MPTVLLARFPPVKRQRRMTRLIMPPTRTTQTRMMQTPTPMTMSLQAQYPTVMAK